MAKSPKPKVRKLSGLLTVDNLELNPSATIKDYAVAASDYVRAASSLTDSQKKTGQIRLSAGLSVALRNDLLTFRRGLNVQVGEHPVSGALRVVNADLLEFHHLDGLRLAVEIKPVNLAVGRAIWNRFGDIRTFAVNLHLKFPFSVVGGVLTFPTSERVKVSKKYPTGWRSTEHLIQRAVKRLVRAGGRQTEGDAPHLLEAIGVLVYDPDTAQIHPTMPEAETGLRWESFVQNLARAHEGRFEGQDDATRAAIAEAAIEAGETPDDPEPGETAT